MVRSNRPGPWTSGGVAAAFCVVTLLGCEGGPSRSGDPGLDAVVRVSPTPASTADTRVAVEVSDAGGPAPGATVRLRAEGPGGPLDVGRLEAREGGGHHSRPMSFPAPGEWTLVVEVAVEGRRATFRRPLTVSGPGG